MKKIIFLTVALVLFLMTKMSFAQDLPRAASFGARFTDLNDSLKAALKLPSLSGTLIAETFEGTSSYKAGFAVNDFLVSLDGEAIKNTSHFLEIFKKRHGGDKMLVGFYRKSKLKETKMLLLPKKMETSVDYDIIYSSVLSGNNHLRALITKPKGNAIYPAVLLISGIGCYSIDNPALAEIKSIKMWSDSLTRNGFVTMRIEKTSMGDSKGIPCSECDFNTEKQGFLDGLKKLKSLPYVDKTNIFIAGFSMGGVIGPLIAQQESVKGIIVYGTVGRNWLEYEIDNSLRQQLLDNRPADSIDLYMRLEYIRLYGLYVEKKLPEQIVKEHPETKEHFFEYPMRIEYFQQVADINIRELWMNTKAKVLAMHGASDFVSSGTEHKLLAETVNRYNPGNATYLEIENADHWSFYAESETISLTPQQTELNALPLITAMKWLKTNL
jgi:pimeloyl-ACP methyl ester carboxylesterase